MDYNQYNIRNATYEINLTKAYVLFWGTCSKGMQNKIESRLDFKSSIIDNPFKKLKAIKEHLTSNQKNWYNMSIILDAIKTLFTTKQNNRKTLQVYTKIFRILRNVLESHIGGPIIMTK